MGKGLKIFAYVILSFFLLACIAYIWFPGLIIQTAKQGMRWHAGLDKNEIKVKDHKWVYLRGGRGEETILFIHGLGADKDHWLPFLCAFSKSYKLIVPDIPGFGESSRLQSASYDVPSQAKRLGCFIDVLGLEKFHLIGISLGGYIAAYYATEREGKIQSLALIDAAGVLPEKHSKVWRSFNTEGYNPFLYKTSEELDTLLDLIFHRPPWIPARFKDYYARKGARELSFRRKVMKDILDGGLYRLQGRLKRINAKTLIIWGKNDKIINVSAADKFAEGIKESRKVVIENCGHVPYFEKPEQTKKVYYDFLKCFAERQK